MTRRKTLRLLEWCLLGLGLACVMFYGAASLHARATQVRAAQALAVTMNDATRTCAAAPPDSTVTCPSALEASAVPASDLLALRSAMLGIPAPNTTSWDPARRECQVRARAALAPDAALARLDIPSIKLAVIVLPGVDALCLNGGVGHIPGTPLPGEPGNVGIAGHRDGFFRGLEHVRQGDVIRLTTARGTFEYRVKWTRIVEPRDVGVLASADSDAVTLVTCYPFRVLGSAPKRYIVRANCVGSMPGSTGVTAEALPNTRPAGLPSAR